MHRFRRLFYTIYMMGRDGYFIKKIIDPMTMMIRVVIIFF